jgi:hypothetical protein
MNLWCGAEPGLELNTWPNKAVERTGNKLALVPRRSPLALGFVEIHEMSSVPLSEIRSIWQKFLVDRAFAQNYTLGYIDHPGPVAKNPVVERLLPSLLHVKAVAILDYALKAWIDGKRLTVPRKPYGTDLKGRIDFLADRGLLADGKALHSIRDTRNEVAHEPEEEVTWQHLDQDVRVIHAVFQELGLVDELRKWDVFSERSAAQEGEIADAICSFHYRIGIRDGERLVAEITWRQHLMRDEA